TDPYHAKNERYEAGDELHARHANEPG
ncbi:MAG: hypothetical protein ACI9HE_002867, partial [Planctomycetota bacterium]